MWYVARKIKTSHFLLSNLALAMLCGCSLQILGVKQDSLPSDGSASSESSSSGINAFSVLGATGGSDTTADSLLTDGNTLTASWVDTSGEDSYEIRVLDSTGSTTLCGPATVAADTTQYAFTGCALSHGVSYRIQVTAKNSANGSAQSAQNNFQVGPFLSVGDLTVNEWGVASIPVTLSYASPSAVSVQYVTVDSSALSTSDYIHSPLATLTIPAGQTSAMISVSLLTDRAVESSEEFRVELSSASGAGLLSASARISLQDNDLPQASGFTQVRAGATHTCALTSAGGVKCWGQNFVGQLGDNSTTDKTVPTNVSGLSSGVIQIAAGGVHSCALTSAGAVKCWGGNSSGQIGDNSMTNKSVPTDVSGLSSGVTQIAAGQVHTCALTTAGAVKCWGWNFSGQIGDNTLTNRSVPTDVLGLSSGVSQIAGGYGHTCAITAAGAAKCWGDNNDGQLGDNTFGDKRVPTNVFNLSSGIAQIQTGQYHTCALTTAAAVKCWGRASNGQLGDNSILDKSIPTDVVGLSSGISQIAGGGFHSCALTSAGAVKCWGSNLFGQIGDGTQNYLLVPTDVMGLSSGVTQISARHNHNCALMNSGAIQCWGDDSYGQLGDNSTTDRSVPTDVSGLASGISQTAAGGTHTCALSTAGAVKCWGENSSHELGDNSTTNKTVPTDASGLSSGVTQIAAGLAHTCALTTAGALKCWGYNFFGQLGDNTWDDKFVPTDVSGLSAGVTQIATGGSHSCVLMTSGAVKCWGESSYGQLGDNNTSVDKNVPADVSALSSEVTQIAAGLEHTCALTTAGAVKCWGNNTNGQLGDNTTTSKSIPTDVSGLSSGVSQIAGGWYHTCALMSSGALKCWGTNSKGQLGDNSITNRLTPTDVFSAASGFSAITAGAEHSCALTTAGAAKCWGINSSGELGDNTQMDKLVPTDVTGLTSGIARISTSSNHTCAVTNEGALKCWGNNRLGQIGDSYSNWVPQFVRSAE